MPLEALTGDSAKVRYARTTFFIRQLRRRVLASTSACKRLGDHPVTSWPSSCIKTQVNDYTFPVREGVREGVRRRFGLEVS